MPRPPGLSPTSRVSHLMILMCSLQPHHQCQLHMHVQQCMWCSCMSGTQMQAPCMAVLHLGISMLKHCLLACCSQ